jgi:regulator of RNase E activity RraA
MKMDTSANDSTSQDPATMVQHIGAIFKNISCTNVSDALDRLKIQGQVDGILPLWSGCPKIAGSAMTIKLAAGTGKSTAIGTLEVIEASKAGDVLVIDFDGRVDLNSWGGIATYTAQYHGLVGCIINGATRDIDEIRMRGFPIFGRGIVVTSVRGRTSLAGYNMPVKLGEVVVNPRDFIFADENGVVVIPNKRLKEVIEIAQYINKKEMEICQDIARGVPAIEAHEKRSYDQWTVT